MYHCQAGFQVDLRITAYFSKTCGRENGMAKNFVGFKRKKLRIGIPI
jgi:hypothetical protein